MEGGKEENECNMSRASRIHSNVRLQSGHFRAKDFLLGSMVEYHPLESRNYIMGCHISAPRGIKLFPGCHLC